MPWSPLQTLKMKNCEARPSSFSKTKAGFSRVIGVRLGFRFSCEKPLVAQTTYSYKSGLDYLVKVKQLSKFLFSRYHDDFGKKYQNTRSIVSEDLFFLEITIILEKKRKYEIKAFFFLENTNFWESLLRAPNFEYSSLLFCTRI